MSDTRLRDAERRALASGSVQDQAALLVARLRAGTLTRERLELAAYCSHPAARLAVPGEPGEFSLANHQRCAHDPGLPVDRAERPCGSRECLERWASGFLHWEPLVRVRAALAATAVGTGEWCDSTRMSGRMGLHATRVAREGRCSRCTSPEPSVVLPGNALNLAEAWLRDPTRENWHRCCVAGTGEINRGTLAHGPWRFLLSLVYVAGHPGGAAVDAWSDVSNCVWRSANIAHSDAQIRSAIQSALVSWALGTP